MKTTLLALVIGTILVGVGIACSDDEATFEEYYREFQAVEAEMRDDLADIVGFNPTTADAETRADFASTLRVAVDAFEGLRPSPEVREDHNVYVRAIREQADAIASNDDDRRVEAVRAEIAALCAIQKIAEREGLTEESVLNFCEGF